MKRVLLIVGFLLSALYGYCACTGPLVITASTNWSTANAGSPPAGNTCIVVKSGATLTLDTNVGAAGAGNGIGWIRIEGNSTVTDDGTGRSIYFNSTGGDPIGSGTAANPGADATAYGFFISIGTISLTGSNGLLTSQDDASPIYIHKQYGNFAGCTTFTANVCDGAANYLAGAVITLKHYTLKHLGTAPAAFNGISNDIRGAYTNPASSIDLENNHIVDMIGVAPNAIVGPMPVTIIANWFDAPRFAAGSGVINYGGSQGTGAIFTYNVMTGQVNAGYLIAGTGAVTGATIDHNSVVLPATVSYAGVWSGTNPTNLQFTNNYVDCSNNSGTTQGVLINGSVGGTDTSTIVDHNILRGCGRQLSLATIGSQMRYYNNWLTVNVKTNGLIVAQPTAAATYDVRNNAGFLESEPSLPGDFTYMLLSLGAADNLALLFQHNTLVMLPQEIRHNNGLVLGQGGATQGLGNSYVHSNLTVGGARGAFMEGNTAAAASTFTGADQFSAFGGSVGVHHNWTYKDPPWALGNVACEGIDTGTYKACSPLATSHFAVEGHPHPDSGYGDINAINPALFSFVTPATFDAWKGGPGTVDDLFTHLEKIWCGAGCGYDPSWQTDRIWAYVMQAARPYNGMACHAGFNGTDIGAAPCYPAAIVQ